MGAWLFMAMMGCAGAEVPSSEPPSAAVTTAAAAPQGPTIPLTLGSHTLQVEVADTDAERARGLMERDGLAQDHGMVFVYPDEQERGFWMKNTRIPLSIAFADAQGRIVHIADMQPLDLRTTRSLRPAMYAVEVEQGWFAAHGVAVGSRIEGLPGPSRE